jgi:hypothetical protein
MATFWQQFGGKVSLQRFDRLDKPYAPYFNPKQEKGIVDA